MDPNSLTSIEDSNFRLAVLGLTVYTASFVCETLRSGVNTVPLGQAEAARSLGLSFGQNLRIILLPQAFRAVIIPLGSVLIALTKNTTIASAIGVAEAALLMKEMIENEAALLVIGTIFAAGFVILTLPLGLVFGWLGKRMAVVRWWFGAVRRPGPRGQVRNHVVTGITVVLTLLALWVVYTRLEAKGQLSAEKWEPFLTANLWTTTSCPASKAR